MDFDEQLDKVGSWGTYQRTLLYCLLVPATLPCAFQAYNQLFMAIEVITYTTFLYHPYVILIVDKLLNLVITTLTITISASIFVIFFLFHKKICSFPCFCYSLIGLFLFLSSLTYGAKKCNLVKRGTRSMFGLLGDISPQGRQPMFILIVRNNAYTVDILWTGLKCINPE